MPASRAPAPSYACATASWLKKFVAFVRPGMGGELVGRIPLFSARPGWWPPWTSTCRVGAALRLWKRPQGQTVSPIPCRSRPPGNAGASAVLAGARRAWRGAVAGLREEPGAPWNRFASPEPQPPVPPETAASDRDRHPSTQAQRCCPRFSRFQPRRTELGLRVRKKADVIWSQPFSRASRGQAGRRTTRPRGLLTLNVQPGLNWGEEQKLQNQEEVVIMETNLAEMPEKRGKNCWSAEIVFWKSEILPSKGKSAASREEALGRVLSVVFVWGMDGCFEWEWRA